MNISFTTPRYTHKASIALYLLNVNEIKKIQVRNFQSPNVKSITTSVRALFYRRSQKIRNNTFSRLYLMIALYMRNRSALYFSGLISGLLLAVVIRILF